MNLNKEQCGKFSSLKNNGCEFGGRLTANTEPSISNLTILTGDYDKACVETMGNPRKG